MDDGTSKSQITLILGLVSMVAICVPCVGYMLYGLMVILTMVFGILAHVEAQTTGEDTTQAKIGMVLAFLPGIAFVAFFALYMVLVVLGAVAGNL